MSKTELSDELAAIQEAWQICEARKDYIYPSKPEVYLYYTDPITEAAVSALTGAQAYLRKQALDLTTGRCNE